MQIPTTKPNAVISYETFIIMTALLLSYSLQVYIVKVHPILRLSIICDVIQCISALFPYGVLYLYKQ